MWVGDRNHLSCWFRHDKHLDRPKSPTEVTWEEYRCLKTGGEEGMNSSEPCGYYHVCTDGNAIPWMFKDDEDFRHGLNRIGICKILTGVFVIAYTLMDNHLHFVLYSSMQGCKDFINKYKLLLGKWIRRKYGEAEAIRGIPSQIIAIKTPEELLETIAYIDRNCIMAGFKGLPADYPWGSATLLRSQKHLSVCTALAATAAL